jgi:hypothetical protein
MINDRLYHIIRVSSSPIAVVETEHVRPAESPEDILVECGFPRILSDMLKGDHSETFVSSCEALLG